MQEGLTLHSSLQFSWSFLKLLKQDILLNVTPRAFHEMECTVVSMQNAHPPTTAADLNASLYSLGFFFLKKGQKYQVFYNRNSQCTKTTAWYFAKFLKRKCLPISTSSKTKCPVPRKFYKPKVHIRTYQ